MCVNKLWYFNYHPDGNVNEIETLQLYLRSSNIIVHFEPYFSHVKNVLFQIGFIFPSKYKYRAKQAGLQLEILRFSIFRYYLTRRRPSQL